jgi:hypothetical protein
MKMKVFKRKKQNYEIEEMEERLDVVLCPVEPRREFVGDLRQRLMARFAVEVSDSAEEAERESSNRWLLAGGVVGTVLMLITSIRGLLSIAGLIGLLIHYFNQEHKQGPASQPAH